MSDHQDTPSDQFEDTSQFSEVSPETGASSGYDGNPHVKAVAESIGPRPPGSDAEREAAAYVAAAFGKLGLPAVRLPAHSPRMSGIQEIGIALASLVALLVAVLLPAAGLILLLALIGLTVADIYGRIRISDWLPHDESVNVLSIVPPTESEVRRLVVTTSLDSGQVGILSRRHWGFLYAWMHVAIIASQVLGMLLSAINLIRGNDGLAPLFAIPGLVLIVVLALLGEREQRDARSPGAITNASGIATLIELAGKTRERPPRWIEVWFLGAGASTAGNAGLGEFLQRNTFDPDITYFVHLQSLGGGPPVMPKNVGAGLRSAPAAPLLTWVFDSVRSDLGTTDMRSIQRLPVPSQSFTTQLAGYQSVVIAGLDADNRIPVFDDSEDLPYQVHETSIDDTVRFLSSAIDALDREVAARAMLARTAASIEDTSAMPVVAGDLPSDDESGTMPIAGQL